LKTRIVNDTLSPALKSCALKSYALKGHGKVIAASCALLWSLACEAAGGVYQTREQFLAQAFGSQTPALQSLWMTDDVQEGASEILARRFEPLRVRYWQRGKRSAWVLEEIGKVRLITIGVVIDDGVIHGLSVMNYRESRGGEVRFPFFTQQFQGLQLLAEGSDQPLDYQLSGSVDGITGATLSVRAMTRIARLALYFHRRVNDQSN